MPIANHIYSFFNLKSCKISLFLNTFLLAIIIVNSSYLYKIYIAPDNCQVKLLAQEVMPSVLAHFSFLHLFVCSLL